MNKVEVSCQSNKFLSCNCKIEDHLESEINEQKVCALNISLINDLSGRVILMPFHETVTLESGRESEGRGSLSWTLEGGQKTEFGANNVLRRCLS